ncbi:rhomboid family intramembrane serine protease [archaeon]|nr:MAG: rhomboid family intramembrane serine protease [archaeon]
MYSLSYLCYFASLQLFMGGYLILIFGHVKYLAIFFLAGIYGQIASCLFLPSTVGVGSSGAIMGMLGAWAVWIVYR